MASRATRSGGRAKTTPTRRTPTRRSTRRQTAEVNQDDVDEALNAHQHNAGDSKDSQATGEGLLSSQSFMMAMRTRRGSTSRDGTSEPGSVMTSDVSSTVTEDDIGKERPLLNLGAVSYFLEVLIYSHMKHVPNLK